MPVLALGVLDGVRVPEGTQALAGAAGLDVEPVAAREVDVPVLERGEPGDVLVLDLVAFGAELGDGGDGPHPDPSLLLGKQGTMPLVEPSEVVLASVKDRRSEVGPVLPAA